MNKMDSAFSRFMVCVFFFMIFPLFRGQSRNFDGSESGSEQNVPTAPAPVPAEILPSPAGLAPALTPHQCRKVRYPAESPLLALAAGGTGSDGPGISNFLMPPGWYLRCF